MSFNVSVGQPQRLRITLNAQILTKVQENLYELAKKDGFTGSLKDFLDSLKVQGENGVTFTPKVENGVLSWENNGNLPNPEPVSLQQCDTIDEAVINYILNNGWNQS